MTVFQHPMRSAFFEVADVADDRLDVVVAERGSERGHRARFAVLDAIGDLGIGERRACELRPLACRTAAIAVAPAAGAGEKLVHVELAFLVLRIYWRRSAGRWLR